MMRNNAASAAGAKILGARLGKGGGSGKAPLVAGGKVKRQLRKPADPAAELMPAAEFLGHETDWGAILEQFRDSPFDPARRRVLGRLMGMFAMDYQGANPEERRFLRRLLAARNAREGYVANRALHLCSAQHAIRRTLALGVAEARYDAGALFGFLGAVQARVAATTFRLLGPKGRERVWNLLVQAGCGASGEPLDGAERMLERALILKAIGARRHRLGPWAAGGERALEEVDAFANDIRGCTRKALATRTSFRTSGGLSEQTPGRSLAERAGAAARAEIDPVIAWTVLGAGPEKVGEQTGAEARDEALPDLDRSHLLDRPRLHQAMAESRAAADGRMAPRHCDALAGYIAGATLSGKRAADKDEALRILRDEAFDVAGAVAVEAIRQDAQGIYKFDAARALGDLLSRFTGATYVRRLFSDQLTAGADPLRQIAAALESGLSVPITINHLRHPALKALAAITRHTEAGDPAWEVGVQVGEIDPRILTIPAKTLLAPTLPEDFGRQVRVDAYMAPAALDLLAPPFGIPFPELGIEDRL